MQRISMYSITKEKARTFFMFAQLVGLFGTALFFASYQCRDRQAACSACPRRKQVSYGLQPEIR